jgi:hypothetical protein
VIRAPRYTSFLGAFALALAFAAAAHAQAERVERLHVDEIVPSPETGEVELYLRAETRYGEPVEALRPTDVEIRDNGALISPSDVVIAPLQDAERGATIVVALDVSRTMKGQPFEHAKASTLSYIDRMGPHDRISVLSFSDRVEVLASFKDTKSRVRDQLRDLQIDRQALTTVLFDGAFKAVDVIRRFDRFGGGSLKSLLKLSRGTSAEAFFAQSEELVASYFDEVWRQMLHSYVVRYPADLDGGHHSIDVTIGGQSDTQSVAFPAAGGGRAIYLVGGALAVVIAIGALYMRRSPSAGRLIFLEGPRKGEAVVLAKPQLSIGALADNDIVVPSAAVSRYHAQLQCRGRYVEIKDVGSSNGTFVNGTNVRSCPLEPGDTVRIGDIDLVYER